MDKTGIDAVKPASKRVVQKTAEVTGDLIGNKIADKITSIGKPKEKEEKTTKAEELYIPPQKRQNLLMILKECSDETLSISQKSAYIKD